MHKQLSLELSLWTVKQFKEGSLEEARHSLGGKVYLLGMVGGGGEAALARTQGRPMSDILLPHHFEVLGHK